MSPQPQQRITPDQALQQAYARHQAGDIAQAKRMYEQILQALPHHAPVLSLLASIAYLEGNDVQAEAFLDTCLGSYRQAVDYKPDDTGLRAGLVNVLLATDRVDEARQHLDALALGLNPIRHGREDFAARRASGQREGLPPMLINTIPKSASESIWNRLAEGMNLAQAHISIGMFPHCELVPHRVRDFAGGGIIAKDHVAANAYNLACLRANGIRKLLVHLRDPRQITLSWAHFVRDDIAQMPLGAIWRQCCPPASVLNGEFAGLLDWCIEHYLPQIVTFMRDWQAVAADPDAPVSVRLQTFEAFRADPDRYFRDVLTFHGVAPTRYAEAEDAHLRKGETDEWREVFSAEQKHRASELIDRDLLEAFDWPSR